MFIVAPVRIHREGLARALGERGELRVQGCAADEESALDAIARLRPDVVLVDTSARRGVAAARVIAARAAAARVVALGAPDDDHTVLACAEAGVSAFVAGEATLDDVVAAAVAVLRGESPCSPRIAATLLRRVADVAREPRYGEFAPLTSRERQVVALIDEGLSNKEIAARLCIELSTVKNHVHNLLEKLGARGRAEAAARMRLLADAPAVARLGRGD